MNQVRPSKKELAEWLYALAAIVRSWDEQATAKYNLGAKDENLAKWRKLANRIGTEANTLWEE